MRQKRTSDARQRKLDARKFLRAYKKLVKEHGFAVTAACCDDAPFLIDLMDGNEQVSKKGGVRAYVREHMKHLGWDVSALFERGCGKAGMMEYQLKQDEPTVGLGLRIYCEVMAIVRAGGTWQKACGEVSLMDWCPYGESDTRDFMTRTLRRIRKEKPEDLVLEICKLALSLEEGFGTAVFIEGLKRTLVTTANGGRDPGAGGKADVSGACEEQS